MYFVFSTLQSDTVRCPDKNRNTQSTGSDTRSQDVKCHCLIFTLLSSVHFSSVAQLCPILCKPKDCTTPAFPVHHQLSEPTQTRVYCLSEAIQPSHPLSSPSPPALNPSQHQGLFQWVSFLHLVTKVLEFQLQHQAFQRTPRTDLL